MLLQSFTVKKTKQNNLLGYHCPAPPPPHNTAPRPSADKSIQLCGTQRLGFSCRVGLGVGGRQGRCGNFCCVCRRYTFQTNQNNCHISHTPPSLISPHQLIPPSTNPHDLRPVITFRLEKAVGSRWIVAVGVGGWL